MRATGDRERRPSPYPRPAHAHRATVSKTSKRRRYIGAASALAVAGAVTIGFMGTSTAVAEGSEREIVFSGQCGVAGLGLGNESVPDKSSMTVTSGDKVTFVNNLGANATLSVGSAKSTVGKGDSKTVTLSESTEAKMSPKCAVMLDDNAEITTVTVKPRQGSSGGSSGGGSSDGGSSNGGGSDSGGSNGGGSDSGSTGGGSSDGGSDAPGDSPDTGKKPKAEGKGGDPNKSDGDKADEESDNGAFSPGDSDNGDGKVDAANQVSSESSASGLLAALAALCLAGVGFAAIRTFIGHRAAASA